MGKFKITCEEATTICTKSQYNEATLIEKLKLQFHLIYCKTCRLFSKQNAQLSDVCALTKGHEKLNEEKALSAEFKKQLEQKLKEGLEKEN